MFSRSKGILPWKLKLIIPALISLVPLNYFRVLFYRYIIGYEIDSSARIGFGTILAVDNAKIGSAFLGMFNIFIGPFNLVIEDGARMSILNIFHCGQWVLDESERQNLSLLRSCTIKRNVKINMKHFFDTTGGFKIGDRSEISGIGSQFWTHGAGVVDKSICIGSDCFIGSAVRFAPGSSVGNCSLVGMGSIVTEKFDDDYLFVGMVPAKIIRKDYDWRKDRDSIGYATTELGNSGVGNL